MTEPVAGSSPPKPAPPPTTDHYGSAAIRRSFVHFVFGKGVAAVSTMLVLFLIVRELSVAEFAAYTSLHALALIIGLVSSLGIPQLLHRFLPELRTHHNNVSMYRLLVGGISARAAAYAALAGLLLLALEPLASVFKLEQWLALLPLYFLVGLLRVNATFIAQALESLLWQRDAQYSLAATALTKLLATAYVVVTGELTLMLFVWIECAAEAVAIVMLLLFMLARWRADPDRAHGNTQVLRDDAGRYLRFGYWCYLQNVTSIFFGSAPNRLFVAYFMSAEFIAVFGVVDRLIDFAKRYEPLHMFVGLVRPVLMSRYSRNNDFPALVRLANLVLFANFALLLAPLAALVVTGDAFLGWMTEGKFGDITWLVIGFYVVLLFGSLNNLVDMLVKAVEHNRVYMVTNLLLSGSLLLAIPLIDRLGLWSIALANLAGLMVSLLLVCLYLRRHGFVYTPEWRHMLVLIGACAVAGTGGLALTWLGMSPWFAGGLTVLAYGVVLVKALPLAPEERASMLEIVPPRLRSMLGKLSSGVTA